MVSRQYTAKLAPREEKRIAAVKVRVVADDFEGEADFTDMQFQEGRPSTGLALKTGTAYTKGAARWHNAVIRGSMTVIIPNLGDVSAGLDIRIYPLQSLAAGVLSVAQTDSAHMAVFTAGANEGDEFALLASTRQCLKNGAPTPKRGFYQYAAAHDSKHRIEIPEGTSARIYVRYTEVFEGVGSA